MAERPVYIPQFEGDLMVKTVFVDFEWFPGLAVSQKQKSVAALHEAIVAAGLARRPLEVSSKSPLVPGVALSAFNLSGTSPSGRTFTVETAFQSSKVFELGGPYRDLLYSTSRVAKKDLRIQESGRLIEFNFFGDVWPLEPKTAFYDWVYIKTLAKNSTLIEELPLYDAFTDIEFNPKRSINCQAYSLSLFRSLEARGILEQALQSKQAFLELAGYEVVSNAREDTAAQPRLV